MAIRLPSLPSTLVRDASAARAYSLSRLLALASSIESRGWDPQFPLGLDETVESDPVAGVDRVIRLLAEHLDDKGAPKRIAFGVDEEGKTRYVDPIAAVQRLEQAKAAGLESDGTVVDGVSRTLALILRYALSGAWTEPTTVHKDASAAASVAANIAQGLAIRQDWLGAIKALAGKVDGAPAGASREWYCKAVGVADGMAQALQSAVIVLRRWPSIDLSKFSSSGPYRKALAEAKALPADATVEQAQRILDTASKPATDKVDWRKVEAATAESASPSVQVLRTLIEAGATLKVIEWIESHGK